MSDPQYEPMFSGAPGRHSQVRKRGRGAGCLAVLMIVALIGVGAVVLVATSWERISDAFFEEVADYEGEGSGKVLVEVKSGDTATDIGNTLVDLGVVASVEAFTSAAAADPRSRGIQVGYYQLAEKMSAAAALEVLVDPDNLIQNAVTIPEGFRVSQIIDRLAASTDFSAAQYRKAIDKLALPASAKGNPEGYLFPATYTLPPDASASAIVQLMLDRFEQAAVDVGLQAGAAKVGLSAHDVVTVASIIQKEVRRIQDMPAVAEVVYNRLSGDCTSAGIPQGLLQMDSTVHFAAGDNDSVFTSDEMRAIDSPYNTYKYAGLPPGPIAAPGEDALAAALDPTSKGWCYFVAVNLESGETAFARTQAEHQANIAKLDEFCRESDLC